MMMDSRSSSARPSSGRMRQKGGAMPETMMAEMAEDFSSMESGMGSPPPPQPRSAGASNGEESLGSKFMGDMKDGASNGAPAASRMLMKDGDVGVSVPYRDPSSSASADAFSEVAAKVKALVTADAEAYIDSENLSTMQNFDQERRFQGLAQLDLRYLQLSVRVPSSSFDVAFSSITALEVSLSSASVKISRQSTNTRDVTSSYIDANSRVAVLAGTEAALSKLMEAAGTTREVLEIQRELTRVINEKEANAKTAKYFEQGAAMSTLRVSVEELAPSTRSGNGEGDKGWSAAATARRAAEGLAAVGILAVDALIFSAVWAAPLGCAVWVARWGLGRAGGGGKKMGNEGGGAL